MRSGPKLPEAVFPGIAARRHGQPGPRIADARTLEAFELSEGHWLLLTTLAGDVPGSLPPFDAITFPLNVLRLEVIAGGEGG